MSPFSSSGHVNCRSNSYAYDRLSRLGFELVPRATFSLRDSASLPWCKQMLFVFRRVASCANEGA